MSTSASEVAMFREETGYPMMVCKVALDEAGGDFEQARKLVRLRFKAKMTASDFRKAIEEARAREVKQ